MKTKGADQLCGNRAADQHLCFRYIDSTIPQLPKSQISSFYPSFVAVQRCLFRTWSETPMTGFLTTRLIDQLNFHLQIVDGQRDLIGDYHLKNRHFIGMLVLFLFSFFPSFYIFPFFFFLSYLCLEYICHGRRMMYLSTIFLTVFRHRGNYCRLRLMCLH